MNNSDYKIEFSTEHTLVERGIESLKLELKECEKIQKNINYFI